VEEENTDEFYKMFSTIHVEEKHIKSINKTQKDEAFVTLKIHT
jgi:hypothetical protein